MKSNANKDGWMVLTLVALLLSGLSCFAQARFVKTVNTIEQMAALNVYDIHTNVFVADTNRGGMFTMVYNPSLNTNNGTVIKSATSGYRYRRNYTGYINATWFGAKGDGSTDDATAIQQAIDCETNLVFFPPRIYFITKPLYITKPRQGMLGYGATLLQGANNTNIIVLCSNQYNATITIEGLTLDYFTAQPSTNTDAIAIYFRGPAAAPQYDWWHCSFRELTIQDAYYGIGKSTYANVWGSFFENLYFYGNSGGAIRFADYNGASPNNYLKSVYVNGLLAGTGLVFHLSGQTGLTMQNCEVNLVTNSVLLLEDCRNTYINNFRIEGGTHTLDYSGLILLSLARGTHINGLEIQTFTFDTANYSSIIYNQSTNSFYANGINLYGVTSENTNTVVYWSSSRGMVEAFNSDGGTSNMVNLLRWQAPYLTLMTDGLPQFGMGNTNIAPITIQATTNLLTAPLDGSFEYDGTNLYFTVGTTRNTVTITP